MLELLKQRFVRGDVNGTIKLVGLGEFSAHILQADECGIAWKAKAEGVTECAPWSAIERIMVNDPAPAKTKDAVADRV